MWVFSVGKSGYFSKTQVSTLCCVCMCRHVTTSSIAADVAAPLDDFTFGVTHFLTPDNCTRGTPGSLQVLLLLLLHPFNGLFSRTTWVSQKGKTSLDLNEARDDRVFRMTVASAGPYANNLHLA